MFSRKIALLAAGYVAGNIVSSLYNSQKGKDVKGMLSEENQKLLEKKKTQVLGVVDSFKSEGDKLLKDVGGKANSISTKTQKLYDEKRDELRSHLQEVSPDEMKAVTDKLFTYFDSFMGKLKKQTPKKVKVVAKKKTIKKPVAKKKVATKKTTTKKVASAKVEIKK